MKLGTQIFLGFLIAISVDLVDSFVNYRLTLRVKTISDFLIRSESVIRQSSELDRGMVTIQSAYRAFLLTGDERFWAQYEQGLKELPGRAREMRAMVPLEEQTVLLDSIMVVYGRWVGYSDSLVMARRKMLAGVHRGASFDGFPGLQLRRGTGLEYNRRIGDLFRRFNGMEYRQRDLRRKELADAIERTDRYSLIFSVVLIVIGLGIAVILVRKISGRIGSLVRLAERISQGDFGRVTDDKKDELTSLSLSLNIMSDKLSRTIGELEKKNTELNQFAYVVSHDLKAPVRGISNVVRWIEEDHAAEISPTVSKYLAFIPRRVTRMEGLIDGLLEYAKAGREGALKEAVDVAVLVAELADLIVPEGCIVRAERLPVLFTERLPLQQVMSNLIANAVKYGPAGSTVISVGCEDQETNYEFSVADNGPGIDPGYHEKIFGLFQTLRDRSDRESTGIGLSIVKKIVEERGGRVRVISSPGQGAKFIFTWPKNS